MSDSLTSSAAHPTLTRSRHRYHERRERILEAATILIDKLGVKGTTLHEVGHAVGLIAPSVAYYFKRKELLAAEVFSNTLHRIEEMVDTAAREKDTPARVERFLALNIEVLAGAIRGDVLPLGSLSDLLALDEKTRAPLEKRYQLIFRKLRGFWGSPRSPIHKALLTSRAHILLQVVLWLPHWVNSYSLVEFPRVHRELMEILSCGIAPPTAKWSPRVITGPPSADGTDAPFGKEHFLRAATVLINQSGYLGASVHRIAEALNVTKGSFYHHLDAKDDLVLECFRRSYRRVAGVKSATEDAGGDSWQQISSTMATLLNVQFDARWPLLRTTALQALPISLREEAIKRSNRLALRFAGTLSDGIRDRSLRLVDPLIASQVIMPMLNTAYDLRIWASRLPREEAARLYTSTLKDGLFNDSVVD